MRCGPLGAFFTSFEKSFLSTYTWAYENTSLTMVLLDQVIKVQEKMLMHDDTLSKITIMLVRT